MLTAKTVKTTFNGNVITIKVLPGREGDTVIKLSNVPKLIVLKKVPYELASQFIHVITNELVLVSLLEHSVELPNCFLVPDADLVIAQYCEEFWEAKLWHTYTQFEHYYVEEETTEKEEAEEEVEEAVFEVVKYTHCGYTISWTPEAEIEVEGEDETAEIPVTVAKLQKEYVVETTTTVKQRCDAKKRDYSCYVTAMIRVTALPLNGKVKAIVEIPEARVKKEITVEVRQRNDAKKRDFGKYVTINVRIGPRRELVGRRVRVLVRFFLV